MANYYLSYIEINGHASMMLSEQELPSGPAKILCEIGFGFDPDRNRYVNFYEKFKGSVFQESIASRALYGGATVRHRTFELSEIEMLDFFRVINRDRIDKDMLIQNKKGGKPRKVELKVKGRSAEEKPSRVQVLVDVPEEMGQGDKIAGTPEYQFLSLNCKTYAMGVFKEMGLVDALSLKNFFIQIPYTHMHQLHKIKKSELSYPKKDQFLEDLSPLIKEMQEDLDALNKQKNYIFIDKHHTGSQKHTEFFEDLQEALETAESIDNSKHRAGYESRFSNNFLKLQSQLAKLSKHQMERRFHPVKNSFVEWKNRMHELSSELAELNREYANDGEEFFWKKTPPVSPRVNFNNFTDAEIAVYHRKAHASEIIDGLAQILAIIDDKLKDRKNLDNDHITDLNALKTLLHNAELKSKEINDEFHASIKGANDQTIASACTRQENDLKKAILQLNINISHYKPQSQEKTNLLVRFIRGVLNLFNIRPLNHIHSAKTYLSEKVSKISAKHKHYCKKTNLFPKREHKPESVEPKSHHPRWHSSSSVKKR